MEVEDLEFTKKEINVNGKVYYLPDPYQDNLTDNVDSCKRHSTKVGNNPKDIAKRRKKNKNKKTHRR